MAGTAEGHEQQASNGNLGPSTATVDTDQNMTADEPAQREGSSDGEAERATRERLKKTSIAGMAQQAKHPTDNDLDPPSHPSDISASVDTEHNGSTSGARGRPPKKRSFEDLTRGEAGTQEHDARSADVDQPNPKSGHHKRMRSRDVASGDGVAARLPTPGHPTSPVHEESDAEACKSPGGPGVLVDAPRDEALQVDPIVAEDAGSMSTNGPSDDTADQQTTTSKPQGSPSLDGPTGFGNASSTSPFGATKSPTKSSSSHDVSGSQTTSASAFASSGLSVFASSEKSPFEAAAKSTSGFAGASTSGGFGSSSTSFGSSSPFASKQPSKGFGNPSGFGSSSASGFGTTTGFGAAKPFGSGLSTFATPASSGGAFGTGKPFGSSKEKYGVEDGSDDSDEEDGSENKDDADEHDDRFVAQDVETGEEEEQTVFACRAKLYHFEKEWKERGVGTIKINMKEEHIQISESEQQGLDEAASGEGKPTDHVRRGRLIMRTDGVHRLILNTPIFKSMTIGQADGSEPIGKTMHLTGLEDGKPRAFQIKIGKEEVMKELYWKVIDLRSEAKA